MPYKLPAKLVEYLKPAPAAGVPGSGMGEVGGALLLHGCAGDDLETEEAALPHGADGQLQRLSAAVEPQGQKLWYLDIEHEEFHPLAKWDDFIADPGRYLNRMIEGEFEGVKSHDINRLSEQRYIKAWTRRNIASLILQPSPKLYAVLQWQLHRRPVRRGAVFVYADSVSELLGQPEPVYRGYSSTAQHRMLVIPEEHWAKALETALC